MTPAPTILIVNDDGYMAKGINELARVAEEFGPVTIVAPDGNRSGRAHSLTTDIPTRTRLVQDDPRMKVYACSGTPVDCVKLALEHLCPQPPSIVLSGINHGSNSSINAIYSGTIGAALEATQSGFPAVGFSLLNHHHDADFSACLPYVKAIIGEVLTHRLPQHVGLNVNIPDTPTIQGIRVCRASWAYWTNSCEKRQDPYGHPYYWLTGEFVCEDREEDTDQWALEHGYISIVPMKPDYTAKEAIDTIAPWFHHS